MRRQVGDQKNVLLEEIEEETGVDFSDTAWNALAKLSQADIMSLTSYIWQVLKKQKEDLAE